MNVAFGGVPAITAEALLERYAVVLLDAYGVLVSSTGALPGAGTFVARLQEIGKPYYVVTNDASRLPATAAARYQAWGLPVDIARIITAGQALPAYFDAHGLRGARAAVLGPSDSVAYVHQAGGIVVPPVGPFDVLVLADDSGYPFFPTVNAVLGSLFRTLDAGGAVALVLPNPDLIYPAGDGTFGFASGSVALMFEAALAARYRRSDLRFTRLGKPYRALFDEALRRSGTRDMVLIGDQVDTDIRGAQAFGIDSVLVGTGVAGPGATGDPDGPRPTYWLAGLA